MVSQEAVFKLVYNAATCFIPHNELTDDQREILDSITIHGCSCKHCRKDNWIGHAYPIQHEIGWSKPFFSKLLKQDMMMTGTLLEAIGTTLHEIIHIIYPDYDEEDVRQKTCEWLSKQLWVSTYREMRCLSRSELAKAGYTVKR